MFIHKMNRHCILFSVVMLLEVIDMSQSAFQIERSKLRKLGLALTRKDGEYRVTFSLNNVRWMMLSHTQKLERMEAVAYYSDDLQDIVDTAKRMLEYTGS